MPARCGSCWVTLAILRIDAMAARLVISETQYVLQQVRGGAWTDLAVLAGGAEALMPSSRAVDERQLEAAIETAEDWLMPHAPGLRGEGLEVQDNLGRLKAGMENVLSVTTSQWSMAEVESFFLRMVDAATGRHPSPLLAGRHHFVADLLALFALEVDDLLSEGRGEDVAGLDAAGAPGAQAHPGQVERQVLGRHAA